MRDRSLDRRGCQREAGRRPQRLTWSTLASRGGQGMKACRGTVHRTVTSKVASHRRAPGAVLPAHRRAACRGTTRSAASSLEPGAKRRLSSGLNRENGGLATTRKGRRGSRRSEASVWTTTTGRPANRRRRACARVRCSSTATTVAPAARRASVRPPSPAPTSRTNSPGRTPARATRSNAQLLRSWCHPHRGWEPPATEDHHGRAHREEI